MVKDEEDNTDYKRRTWNISAKQLHKPWRYNFKVRDLTTREKSHFTSKSRRAQNRFFMSFAETVARSAWKKEKKKTINTTSDIVARVPRNKYSRLKISLPSGEVKQGQIRFILPVFLSDFLNIDLEFFLQF